MNFSCLFRFCCKKGFRKESLIKKEKEFIEHLLTKGKELNQAEAFSSWLY